MSDSGGPGDLSSLRTALGEVDRKLIELIKRRQELSSQIGAIKRAAGRPTRDYVQERQVIERAVAMGRTLGVDDSIAEQLMLMLIRSSLTVQEQDTVRATSQATAQRVAVIGGAGKMGAWLVRFLGSQGYEVDVADPSSPHPDDSRDWHDLTLDHDLIILATPLNVSNDILLELADKPPAGVVFDIGSLKSPVRRGLRALAAAGGRVTSVHPMFGPGTRLLSGRHVIFVDVGCAEATEAARRLFEPTMAVQVDMELEDHDRLIAYVLGLSHALNLAFASALADSGEAAPHLARLSSTTFDAQLAISASVASESPELYFEIQSLNDYGSESLSALLLAVERLRSVVRAKDAAGFSRLMKRCADYLAERPAGADAPP